MKANAIRLNRILPVAGGLALSFLLGLPAHPSTPPAPSADPSNNLPDAPQNARAESIHWAFLPPSKPSPPPDPTGWSANPVDQFVRAALNARHLQPAPSAESGILVRRLAYNLTGLPPDPGTIESFLAGSAAPTAWARLVDRFLELPHYGERWGRHWLDVAGFAESSMFIGDVPRPGLWRYRDYVIRAFNEDKPFDRFVVEQLAGDELFNWRDADTFSGAQLDLLAATGFLRCTPDATDNQPITQMDKRHAAQQSAVEVSMKALLGLTLNCVRCHDHKFDPISQEEYYGLIAVFQPAFDPGQWLPGIYTRERVGPFRGIPMVPGPKRRRILSQAPDWYEERLDLGEQLRGGLERQYRDQALRNHAETMPDPDTRRQILAALDQPFDQRTDQDEALCAGEADRLGLTEERIKELFPDFERQLESAKERVEELKQLNLSFENVIWAAFDTTTSPTPTRFLQRGNYETPAHEVAPGVLQALHHESQPVDFNHPPGDWTTGRRLALARWIAGRNHPLTARVLVNRIWQYHFGTGLVSTPDDFGARGALPVSQDLLDWLAVEFMENGWSVKHLHRLILNSNTYRQTGPGPEHFPAAFLAAPRRLEAEAIRDAMLDVAGQLDRRLYGPSIPTERRKDGSFHIKAGHPDRFRRSIYISTRRTYVPTFLALFDQPAMDTNWPDRSRSAIAQQALAVMNDPFVIECADAFARRILDHVPAEDSDSAGLSRFDLRLRHAYLLAYGRPPHPEETALLRPVAGHGGDPKSWRAICHALISANEFIYID